MMNYKNYNYLRDMAMAQPSVRKEILLGSLEEDQPYVRLINKDQQEFKEAIRKAAIAFSKSLAARQEGDLPNLEAVNVLGLAVTTLIGIRTFNNINMLKQGESINLIVDSVRSKGSIKETLDDDGKFLQVEWHLGNLRNSDNREPRELPPISLTGTNTKSELRKLTTHLGDYATHFYLDFAISGGKAHSNFRGKDEFIFAVQYHSGIDRLEIEIITFSNNGQFGFNEHRYYRMGDTHNAFIEAMKN